MPSQNDNRTPRTVEVESMSLEQRQARINAGVIDVSQAPDDVQAFTERATRRYLNTFTE
ncbi:MAG: hypothetical protein ACRBK7_12225 [Acidimicrobiales bacterium]